MVCAGGSGDDMNEHPQHVLVLDMQRCRLLVRWREVVIDSLNYLSLDSEGNLG